MKFTFNLIVTIISCLLLVFSCRTSGADEKSGKNTRKSETITQQNTDPKPMETPFIIKSEPVFYNGPPNLNDKYIHKIVDAFNPFHHPENTPEYPDYDVLPDVDHFYTGKVRLQKRKEKITEEEAVEKLKKELAELKKELFNNDEAQIKKVREDNKAYDSMWLRSQLYINRVVDLDDFIKNKKNKESLPEKKEKEEKVNTE